jgi:sensor histidine kinase YesM
MLKFRDHLLVFKKSKNMTKKRKEILVILLYGLISMLIGFFFQWISCPQCIRIPRAVIQNMGYSLMLGYGLFFNRYIYILAIEPFVSWIKRPVRSVFISFGITTLYSSFIIFFTNWFWFTFIQGLPLRIFLRRYVGIWGTEFVILYFISMWFYARAFFMDWKKEFQKREMLKREALSAQYDVLKSQVNPHFLVNSLNVAASLVDKDPEISKKFLSQLSGIYRDILEFQDHDLVSLDKELKLASRYLFLQEMRFGKAFNFQLPKAVPKHYQIIPLSVQILVENAFKHNKFTCEKPMSIEVVLQDKHLFVRNNCYNQSDPMESLNIGLDNIRGRFQFLTGKGIEILNRNNIFEVKIPLIIEE